MELGDVETGLWLAICYAESESIVGASTVGIQAAGQHNKIMIAVNPSSQDTYGPTAKDVRNNAFHQKFMCPNKEQIFQV